MSSSVQSELIVTNEKGEFRGKISSLSLFNKVGLISQVGVLDEECMIIEHDASLQKAMEIASSFVGEIIPIIDKQTNKAVAVITEGAIFKPIYQNKIKPSKWKKDEEKLFINLVCSTVFVFSIKSCLCWYRISLRC